MERESALLIQIQSPDGDWLDVGHLYRHNERSWFEFDDSYWSRANRPILGQIFEEDGRTWQGHTQVALPRWFSHLLPEGMLRDAVARAAGVNRKREFELLRRLGSTDLPGAIRAVEVSEVRDLARAPAELDEGEDVESEPLLKFSLAGAQLKFSIYGDGRGLTVPASGQAGNFIVKFPDGRPGKDRVPESEFAAMELARATGITVPGTRLINPTEIYGLDEWTKGSTGLALAVERFDRKDDGQRVHMEELAQILNIPTSREQAKYLNANFETVAIFVAALAGVEAVGEVIDRIVLNILVGNGDAHVKNWSFLYPDGRHPQLSPVYDVLPTVLFVQNDDLGMNLNGSKDFAAMTSKSFDSLASRSGYGVELARLRARDAVERTMASWEILKTYLSTDQYRVLTDRAAALPMLTD